MDSEEMAWAWLQRMVEGLCDETPEDLAYSADQMVDATPPETADERCEGEQAARCHNIKCWPEPFEAMKRGEKTAEFRLNDRDYRVGDTLLIREWCPATGEYTHREIHRSITHVLSEGFGLPKGYVMLSLAALDAARGESADERQAAIVAALRDDAQRCDCFARSEGECACGAWDTEPGERSYKRKGVEDIADWIASGEWRRT